MLLLRTSPFGSSLTLLPCVACLSLTTLLVTKLSTSTLLPSSCVVTTSGTLLISGTTVAPAEASNLATRCASYVSPLTRAYKGRAYTSESGTKRAAVECRPTERIEPRQERECDVVVNIDPVHESPYDVHLRLPDLLTGYSRKPKNQGDICVDVLYRCEPISDEFLQYSTVTGILVYLWDYQTIDVRESLVMPFRALLEQGFNRGI
jgi:hypothetical protein